MQKNKLKTTLAFMLVFLAGTFITNAVTRKAQNNTTPAKIIQWINDVNVDRIELLAKTYNFSAPILIKANKSGMTIIGAGKNATKLVLTANKKVFINALASNLKFLNLTLDAGSKSSEFGATIFFFNKSKRHKFTNVHFKNCKQDGINSPVGWACEGLRATKCEFTNIKKVCINIFNRNTNKRGNVITSIEKFIVDDCKFNEGYERAVVVDCGNDRQNVSGTNKGPRYRQSTSLNYSEVKNSQFNKTNKFHIGGVQVAKYNIWNNVFEGLRNVGTPGDLIHLEQFARDIEIFDNTFKMANNLQRKHVYISIGGTEGHRRIDDTNDNTNPAAWRFKVNGGSERRAKTQCATNGDNDGTCKRDHHSYGSRNIYIAKNTFAGSNSINKYIKMIEGENNHIGWRRNGNAVNNTFSGNNNAEKIILGGNHLGTCNVRFRSGQNLNANNIKQNNVHFGAAKCRNSKPNKLGGTNLPGVANNDLKTLEFNQNDELLSIAPNPAVNSVTINTNAAYYTISISNISGRTVKTVNGDSNAKTIDVSNLNQGIYMLMIQTNEGESKVEKLIIN